MKLVGDRLIIPLCDAVLTQTTSYELCEGISLFTLSEGYRNRLSDQKELTARYSHSLDHMKCGLSVEPRKLMTGGPLSWYRLMELSVFVAMSIRLATGVPVDIPFWFACDGEEIKGYGNTLLHTYRHGNRYEYPLDDGKQSRGFFALRNGIAEIAQKQISDSNKNVLVRAVEFAIIGFQTRHIPMRLVNNTIFLESLFSGSNTEIAFQIAASVSWYLRADHNADERMKLFSDVKQLYGYRSKVVHGADISSKNRNLQESVLFGEELNSEIFATILEKRHVEIFSWKQVKRQQELKLLALGADCALRKSHDG